MQTDPFDIARPYWFEAVQTFPGESAPAGTQLEISMDGGASLADTALACQLSIEAQVSGKSMVASFAGPMPYVENVQLYDGSTLIYGGASFGQPQLMFDHWPQRVRQEIVGGLPEEEVQFDVLSPVTLNGLPIGTGNRIVIHQDGLVFTPMVTFSRHRVRVMGIDSVLVWPLLPPTLVARAGAGTFDGPTSFATSAGPRSVAIGDLDRDGNPDIVVANSTAGSVSVRLGDGHGGFGAKTDWSTLGQPWAVAIGDVTGDGIPDLVVAERSANQVSVLPGSGGGVFGTRADYPTASSPSAVAIADLNGDGRADVLVACSGVGGGISVLLQDASGGLGVKTDFAAGAAPVALAIGEITGDGRPDVVVANSGSNDVSLLAGNGLGGFGPRIDFPAGSEPWSAALADFNRDGTPDLVVANHSGGTISVLPGFGPGSFGTPTSIVVGGAPTAIAVADVNGDETQDIVVANPTSGTARLLFGNGAGGVSSQIDLIQGAQPNGVAVGDVNNDGTPDVVDVDGSGNFSVLLGQGGNVSPPGEHAFTAGDSPSFTITPSPDFVIVNVLVDGVAKGAISSYQFHDVNQAHTLTAKFSRVTAVDLPGPSSELALSGVLPNPSSGGRVHVRFTLAVARSARLEFLDIGGRRIAEREVGGLGPGEHTVVLDAGVKLKPGLYWIRLTQASTQRTAKIIVIE